MDSLKQIMYGVTDFALMRTENAYFVDRTGFIRELEKTHYAIFLRPRRFGKSLFCSILQCYYDVAYAARFDEFFGGLDIGRNPTAERGKYLFLNFNFTGVEKQFDRVQSSFNDYCCLRLDKFARDFADRMPAGVADAILSAAGEQIDRYAADRDLARKWNLTTQGGTVTLHRIVLVFHGGDVALSEELA